MIDKNNYSLFYKFNLISNLLNHFFPISSSRYLLKSFRIYSSKPINLENSLLLNDKSVHLVIDLTDAFLVVEQIKAIYPK